MHKKTNRKHCRRAWRPSRILQAKPFLCDTLHAVEAGSFSRRRYHVRTMVAKLGNAMLLAIISFKVFWLRLAGISMSSSHPMKRAISCRNTIESRVNEYKHVLFVKHGVFKLKGLDHGVRHGFCDMSTKTSLKTSSASGEIHSGRSKALRCEAAAQSNKSFERGFNLSPVALKPGLLVQPAHARLRFSLLRNFSDCNLHLRMLSPWPTVMPRAFSVSDACRQGRQGCIVQQ